jgi:hypothetical protein
MAKDTELPAAASHLGLEYQRKCSGRYRKIAYPVEVLGTAVPTFFREVLVKIIQRTLGLTIFILLTRSVNCSSTAMSYQEWISYRRVKLTTAGHTVNGQLFLTVMVLALLKPMTRDKAAKEDFILAIRKKRSSVTFKGLRERWIWMELGDGEFGKSPLGYIYIGRDAIHSSFRPPHSQPSMPMGR